MNRKRIDLWRNLIARFIGNVAYRYIATDWYEAQIEHSIAYGIRSHMRDMLEGRDPPPTLQDLGLDDSWCRFESSNRRMMRPHIYD